jgi:hypothetical protein
LIDFASVRTPIEVPAAARSRCGIRLDKIEAFLMRIRTVTLLYLICTVSTVNLFRGAARPAFPPRDEGLTKLKLGLPASSGAGPFSARDGLHLLS